MDLSMMPVDNIYGDIKIWITGILFKNSPVYKSIQDDIEEIIDGYNEDFEKIRKQIIHGLPINKKEKEFIDKIQEVKINGIPINIENIKINMKDKEESKKFQNNFEKLIGMLGNINPEIKELFEKFKIKVESFGKIFKEETLNYKKGANRTLLIKEKEGLMKSLNLLITKGMDIFVKENTAKMSKDDILKQAIVIIDKIFMDIIDRVCVK